jgi:hypothetical protein
MNGQEYLGGQGEPFFIPRRKQGAVDNMGAWGAWDALTILVRSSSEKGGLPKQPSDSLGGFFSFCLS